MSSTIQDLPSGVMNPLTFDSHGIQTTLDAEVVSKSSLRRIASTFTPRGQQKSHNRRHSCSNSSYDKTTSFHDLYNSLPLPTPLTFSAPLCHDPISVEYNEHESRVYASPEPTETSESSESHSEGPEMLSQEDKAILFDDQCSSWPTPPHTPVTREILFTVGSYNVLELLGTGSFSKVYLAEDSRSTSRLVAIKMIEKASGMHGRRLRTLVSREIEFLTMVDHPNIVAYYETVQTETHTCLVLEYVKGAELYDFVANENPILSNPSKIQQVFSQLVFAVEHLHDRNICHRDLKLENVLIQEDHDNLTVKLSDLGLAEYVSDISYLSSRCGTEEYCAPEILLGQSTDGVKADIWSLGIILFTMVAGHLPFNLEPNESRRAFYARINRAEYECPSKVSEEAHDLISKLLQSQPSQRATIDDIKKHQWLQHLF
ncbi:hypothetical protein K7432_008374 [Basidiobolus ranarum]|uniref:Protein kinase domain-containing protein n=1 Tax=Basidiobolus ranarum TaxID=34480 RepID=A0ABR2WRV9_9FUNG